MVETFKHPDLEGPVRDRGERAFTIRMDAQFTYATG